MEKQQHPESAVGCQSQLTMGFFRYRQIQLFCPLAARLNIITLRGDSPLPADKCCAAVAGYGVNAGVCVPARDRMRLERLARYAGRPPLAAEPQNGVRLS
jgi:hypothetical protein